MPATVRVWLITGCLYDLRKQMPRHDQVLTRAQLTTLAQRADAARHEAMGAGDDEEPEEDS
jgi:hypothetical protein